MDLNGNMYNKIMKKSELKQIIREEIQKLNECFIIDTFIDLFKENPRIFDILKNSILSMDGNIIKYKNIENLADDFTHWGGALGFDGTKNWNKKDVIKFFEKLEKNNTITLQTLILLKQEMEKEYDVFTKKYMIDTLKKVGKRMEKLYGNKEWTSNAMCDLSLNLNLPS
jgi:hypothetical protein